MRRSILIGLLAAAVAACGGDGLSASSNDDDGPILPGENPAGLWQGTFTSDTAQTAFFAIIAETAETHFISGGRRTQLIGTTTVSGDDLFADLNRFERLTTTAKDADLNGTVTVSATINERDSIRGTFESEPPTDTGTVNLFYDSLYERSSDLTKLASVWTDSAADFTLTLTISPDGFLTGSDSDGCNYTGQVSIIDPDFNAYDLTLQIASTGGTCGLTGGAYQGLMTLVDTVTEEDTLVFSVNRPTRAIAGTLRRM